VLQFAAMRAALRKLLRVVAITASVAVGLALAGFAYGWAARGLLLTTDDVEYARPEDHPVVLPRDHAAHPDFKTEWWYWTGHLAADDGREYGFELVFFRLRTPGVWHDHLPVWWFLKSHATVAQFAIVDKRTGEHVVADRRAENSRSDVGAATDRLHVWTYDWSASAAPPGRDEDGVRLVAAMDRYAIDLRLTPEKPAVLHGDRGLMRRDPGGITSNYVSFTRLAVAGRLRVDGSERWVTGQAWHDHEYASGTLPPGTAGWDWFSIQLDKGAGATPLDGTELMVYLLRGTDGAALDGSKGTLVAADGTHATLLLGRDFRVTTGTEGVWRSPDSGAPYPLGWRIDLPARGWTLDVSPVARAQEVLGPAIGVNYWEGAARVRARTPDGEIGGVAYVELCGYDKRVDKF